MAINRSPRTKSALSPLSDSGANAGRSLRAAMLVLSGAIVPASAQQAIPQSTRGGPVTPSARLNAPYPPAEEGCHRLKDSKWVEIPCATDEELRQQHFPLPSAVNAIQSNPHVSIIIDGRPESVTTPFIWGSVTAAFLTDPRKGTETDGTPNAFSLQNNTNYFTCGTCRSGYPFGAISGISNSASQAGDVGWVQFAYQNYGGSSARLCIFQIDMSVNIYTNGAYFGSNVNGGYANTNEAGFHADCVPNLPITAPLTGQGAVVPESGQSPGVGDAEVIGYITCPSAGSNAGCMLELVAYLPWADENWWSITKKDALGLAGNWINVDGGILGSGGNSKAVFSSGTKIEQVIRAYSCVNFLQPGYIPESCPAPVFPIERMYELYASATFSPYTGETNNLTNDPPTFTCGAFDCWLTWVSTAP
jgi:hypothetical protein